LNIRNRENYENTIKNNNRINVSNDSTNINLSNLLDMLTKVKLYWLTTSGCEWLEETVEITKENYKTVLTDYFNRTESQANSLVNKWNSNGEEVSMYFETENIDTPAGTYRPLSIFTDTFV